MKGSVINYLYLLGRKLAVKGATKIDLSGIHFQKGDFSLTKNHRGSFKDKKNNAERIEVSKPAREGSNKLFGSPIKSPSLDKKVLENARKIMAARPGLTTQGGGGENQSMISIDSHFSPMFNGPIESIVVINKEILDYRSHSTVIFKENRDFKNVKSTKVGSSNGRGKGILISKGRGFRNKRDTA
ncbi:hypothetical protein Goari_018090 [Gossypium aridum]|uniref:Uncharacterized protein n=1 Tax=Gossypium aridum TaxID=34290 RepID=A0A7J8WNZ6_GOSAI|nr:hypothetical protein [Gossypium aridum]